MKSSDARQQTTHTAGPWITDNHFVERQGGRTYLPVMRPGNDPVPIAVVHRDVDGYGRQEGEANARLIAAAPDLLAALKAVVAISDRKHDTWDAAKAAIAMAEGR